MMRRRMMFGWLPIVLLAALALPGAVLASDYHRTILINACAATGHKVEFKIRAVADADMFANEIDWAFKTQVRRGGRWRNANMVAWAEPYDMDGTTHVWTEDKIAQNASHRVRVISSISFRQDGLVAWRFTDTSIAC